VSRPALSVVVPAYNEALRLPATLARVRLYLATRGVEHEILVVDDGSSDGTAEVARAVGDVVRVLRHEPNRGKGYAVRRGMLAATGVLRLMTDADLSTPIEELARLEAEIDGGFDVEQATDVAGEGAEGGCGERHVVPRQGAAGADQNHPEMIGRARRQSA